jgi:hypothetical protein
MATCHNPIMLRPKSGDIVCGLEKGSTASISSARRKKMSSTSTSQTGGALRETAQKMIRCMGAKDAMACCINNQWIGIWQEIQTITGANLHR